MVVCKQSKELFPLTGTLIVLGSTLFHLLLTLTLCILCQSLLCSRPHHTSLNFFYCTIVLIMITDPLAVTLSTNTFLGDYAELVTLSAFFFALFSTLLLCIYFKHKDYFSSTSID